MKRKYFSKKKSAFSLIELSIVLIIIGLLIAGVTGGASLIKSSELRSVATEARAWATCVNGFYNQFNALPGDYATTVGTGTLGDGDGAIEFYSAAATVSESASAWQQMRTAGIVDSTIIGSTTLIAYTTAPTFSGTSNNAPASKIKASGWVFDYCLYTNATTNCTTNAISQNQVILTGTISSMTGASATVTFTNGAASNLATGSLTPTDALSVDAKIDDGIGHTGKVRGVNTQSITNCMVTTTGVYATTTNPQTKTCALSYQVDVNS